MISISANAPLIDAFLKKALKQTLHLKYMGFNVNHNAHIADEM